MVDIKRLDKPTLNELINEMDENADTLNLKSYYIPNEDEEVINILSEMINERNIKISFFDNKVKKRIKSNIKNLIYIKYSKDIDGYFEWFKSILKRSLYIIKDDNNLMPLILKRMDEQKIIAEKYEVDKSMRIKNHSEVILNKETIYKENYRFPVSKKEYLIMEMIGGKINVY